MHDKLRKLAAAIGLVVPLLGASVAGAQDKVVFQIDGNVVPFYAPLYAGVENGFSRTRISRSNSFTQALPTS